MRPFQISKESSFRDYPRSESSRMDIEEDTVLQVSILKVIHKPIKFITPPPNPLKEITNKTRKACNCKKSQCLKQYCECFANEQMCTEECNCCGCLNTHQHQKVRKQAKISIVHRDPAAFKAAHKGCNCRKSGCQKKYCECYQNGIECSKMCHCDGCLNCKENRQLK